MVLEVAIVCRCCWKYIDGVGSCYSISMVLEVAIVYRWRWKDMTVDQNRVGMYHDPSVLREQGVWVV